MTLQINKTYEEGLPVPHVVELVMSLLFAYSVLFTLFSKIKHATFRVQPHV